MAFVIVNVEMIIICILHLHKWHHHPTSYSCQKTRSKLFLNPTQARPAGSSSKTWPPFVFCSLLCCPSWSRAPGSSHLDLHRSFYPCPHFHLGPLESLLHTGVIVICSFYLEFCYRDPSITAFPHHFRTWGAQTRHTKWDHTWPPI